MKVLKLFIFGFVMGAIALLAYRLTADHHWPTEEPGCYEIIVSDEGYTLMAEALDVCRAIQPYLERTSTPADLDLNTATVDQIAHLPRSLVGQELAETIVMLRMEAPFDSWEDLRRRAAGIGQKTITAMQLGADIREPPIDTGPATPVE